MTSGKPSSERERGSPEAMLTRVHLVPDEPSASDDFDAKAHDQVAQSIAALVRNEPGGKVIGLEGLWGSGKSTVVRLVRQHLTTEKASGHPRIETRVVVFDAWAHQGDPLRRTFLEAVITELEDAEWL